jgi:hypothetical protein
MPWPLENLLSVVYMIKDLDRLHGPNEAYIEKWKDLSGSKAWKDEYTLAVGCADWVIEHVFMGGASYQQLLSSRLSEIATIPARFALADIDEEQAQGMQQALDWPVPDLPEGSTASLTLSLDETVAS